MAKVNDAHAGRDGEELFLSVDVGNTTIDAGLFLAGGLILHRKLLTDPGLPAAYYRVRLQECLAAHLGGRALNGAAVCAVVAGMGDRLLQAVQPLCTGPALQAEAAWDLGIAIDYDHPGHVGIDRLLAASAARSRAPSGSGLVIADAGTAITVDAVDRAGTFLGGLILPGLRLWLKALYEGTSLLPETEPVADAPLLGKNTRAGMQAGVLHGAAALLDGLFDRLADQLGSPVEGFLTGGDSALLRTHITRFNYFDPALILEGLRLAYARLLGNRY